MGSAGLVLLDADGSRTCMINMLGNILCMKMNYVRRWGKKSPSL